MSYAYQTFDVVAEPSVPSAMFPDLLIDVVPVGALVQVEGCWDPDSLWEVIGHKKTERGFFSHTLRWLCGRRRPPQRWMTISTALNDLEEAPPLVAIAIMGQARYSR